MRILFLLTCFLFITSTAQAQLKVFACEPEWTALVNEIAGDEASVYTATTALQDPHHIEARPSLIAKMRSADLVICTGAGLEEGWLPLVIRQAANEKVLPGTPGHFMAAMRVERLDIPQQVDRSMGDVHPQGNPHVHLDPHRVASIARQLTATLSAVDQVNAAYYRQRQDVFLNKWKQAITRWEQQAAVLKGKTVVSYHKDWIYLLNWLEMQLVATLESKPGIAPSAGRLADLKAILKQQPATMVLYASYQSNKAAKWLSDEMHIPLVELPYTVGANEHAKDLISLYDNTIQRLLSAVDTKS